MLKALSFISSITGLLALIIVAYGLYGLMSGAFDGPQGMGMLFVTFWGLVLTALALLTGFIAFFIARGRTLALPQPGKLGLWAGGSAGTILALVLVLG